MLISTNDEYDDDDDEEMEINMYSLGVYLLGCKLLFGI